MKDIRNNQTREGKVSQAVKWCINQEWLDRLMRDDVPSTNIMVGYSTGLIYWWAHRRRDGRWVLKSGYGNQRPDNIYIPPELTQDAYRANSLSGKYRVTPCFVIEASWASGKYTRRCRMKKIDMSWEEFCSSYDLTHWKWDTLPPSAERISEDEAVIELTAREFFDDPDIEFFVSGDRICILSSDDDEEYFCVPLDEIPNIIRVYVVAYNGNMWRLREFS